ncbi:putative secreted protein [Nonlabens ulvanivorans]|nr:putative secreted protein [Nonlabens ulvanivorans]GAK94155.1 putative secreted protein [Nonlabens ulvanivorans]
MKKQIKAVEEFHTAFQLGMNHQLKEILQNVEINYVLN